MRVGVLALQGAFIEHQKMLDKLGVETLQVRKPEQLADIAGLVIPGGESTAIGKLMLDFGLFTAIKDRFAQGMGVFGTCAGLILIASDIAGSEQPRLALMNTRVKRNAYGRQTASFEVDLPIAELGDEPLKSVFIRAPYIEEAGDGVEVLSTFENKIVLARQGKALAAAFHPELTDDTRLHQYFIDMCK